MAGEIRELQDAVDLYPKGDPVKDSERVQALKIERAYEWGLPLQGFEPDRPPQRSRLRRVVSLLPFAR